MPPNTWDDPNASMRGLWGSLVSSAAVGESTADVWQRLRDSAQSWAEGVLGVTSGGEATPEEIQAKASTFLRGVSAADVSRWRGEAGRYVQAQQAAMAQEGSQQIEAASIFRRNHSLWGSASNAIKTYRVRIKYAFDVGAEHGEEWSTYRIGGPLTNLDDIFERVSAAFNRQDYNRNTTIGTFLEWSIEEV